MLLQTVRPNIVQSIRAYRVEDLMQAAQDAGQHFLYANMANAQSTGPTPGSASKWLISRSGASSLTGVSL